MKRLFLTMIVAAAMAGTGCVHYTAPVKPPRAIFTHIKAPLTTDFDATDVGTKTGKASTAYVRIPLYWFDLDFAWRQADLAAAARNGGITTVTYADYEYVSILGVFCEFTTIAHGN